MNWDNKTCGVWESVMCGWLVTGPNMRASPPWSSETETDLDLKVTKTDYERGWQVGCVTQGHNLSRS